MSALQINVVSDLCVCVCVGFKVAVISRDSSRLERLQSFVSPTTKDNLTTIVGNVGTSAHPILIIFISVTERLCYL